MDVPIENVFVEVGIGSDGTTDLERVVVRIQQLNDSDPTKWVIITRQSRRAITHGWSHISQVSFPAQHAIRVFKAVSDMHMYWGTQEFGGSDNDLSQFAGPFQRITANEP